MAFLNTCGAGCPEFICSTPWQHEKISWFNNSLYTMPVINAHQPYPTPYVGKMREELSCVIISFEVIRRRPNYNKNVSLSLSLSFEFQFQLQLRL